METASAQTIVLIHGLWMTPLAWEDWVARYRARGHNAATGSQAIGGLRSSERSYNAVIRRRARAPEQGSPVLDESTMGLAVEFYDIPSMSGTARHCRSWIRSVTS